MSEDTIAVNRAPVLTLWGAVVAERLGHERDTALTLGRCLSGLNAQSKGRMIGVFGPPKGAGGETPSKTGLGEEFWIPLCERSLPAKNTPNGVRAVVEDEPIDPAKVEQYLQKAFGAALPEVRRAMEDLAASYSPEDLAALGYKLYERFRPTIASGKAGWGQKGTLDLALIRSLAAR